ncbi:hypothetical protein GALMADRAFT_238925 [Galerina marginata CBS 339.88]|uniref:BTB domain-containing protein n=1 Tax=Galerina marginata (strain CBS 339.88) TaxID=685588 RepID=A0A067TVT0_GALM3|nr:hypothetical protein GALMADRAFT_238925 [Galerina marginata CBS 339.88]
MHAEWKDAKYYFPNGDITLLVSKTLFKVHRYILARDGSTFENMFALDNVDRQATEPSRINQTSGRFRSGSDTFEQDGVSDENPIQMQGDTVDEFRDLLWSLYALPHEIMLAMSSEGDTVKLSNVARMAHKYHFGTTESWALQALLTCVQTPTAASSSDTPGSSSTRGGHLETHALIQITEAAVLCMHPALLNAVKLKWKARISDRKDLGAAINVTERLGLRDLCGLAYYNTLLQGRDVWEAEPLLNREQRIRLLSGYHNLSRAGEQLADLPPELLHEPNCAIDQCNEGWGGFWQRMLSPDPIIGIGAQVLRHDRLDIVGRLLMAVSIMSAVDNGSLSELLPRSFSAEGECVKPALDATLAYWRKTQDGLMDFFQDVL